MPYIYIYIDTLENKEDTIFHEDNVLIHPEGRNNIIDFPCLFTNSWHESNRTSLRCIRKKDFDLVNHCQRKTW